MAITNFDFDDGLRKKSAQEIFTDRTAPQDVFANAYKEVYAHTKNGENYSHVINFYGVGGIGKTELVNRLESNLLKEKEFQSIRFSFRFSTASVKDIIERMAKILIKNYKFEFPVTAYAILRLFMLEGDSFDLAPETLSNNVENNQVIGTIAALIKCFTPLTNLVQLGQDLLSIKNNKQENKFNKILKSSVNDIQGKHLIAEIDSYSSEEIRKKLHYYFSYDLRIAIAKTKKPLVVFFDTYEHYVNKIRNSFASCNDEWIRTVIKRTPGVLWVISGRERLSKIDENEEDPWKELGIEEHRLEKLSEKDQREYFTKMAEIAEPELIDHFISLSDGIPILMDLCYSTYVNLINSNKDYTDISLYGKNQDQILLRYFELMDHNTKNLLIDLAIIEGGWDDELIKALKINFSEYYDYERYSLLCQISLITKDEGNRYSIPNAVRKAILQTTPRERIENIQTIVSQYYLDKHKKESNSAPADSIIKCIDNKIKSEISFEFYKDNIHETLIEYLSNYRIEDSAALIYRFDQIIEVLDYDTRAIFLYGKSIFFTKSGTIKAGLEIVTSEFEFLKNKITTQIANLWLHNAMHEILYSNGLYEEALNYCTKSYELTSSIYGEESLEQYATLNHLSIINAALGNYQEALEYNLKCYEFEKAILGDEHPDTLTSLNNLALTYSYLGQYQEALEYNLKCYKLMKEVLGDEHPNTITTLSNLASCYSNLGRYQEALEYNLKCYELRKAILGEDHPDTLKSLGNLAYCYSNLGRYQETLEYNLKCYELMKEVLGDEHPNTLTSLGNLADCYSSLGRYQEALEYNLKCYELRKTTLGEDHPDTLTSVNNLATTYSYLGKYQEALEYNLKCYELMKKVLGDVHPDTIATLNNLASCYSNLGRYQEALEYNSKCYELRKAILGDEHPDTLASLNSLAVCYSNLDRYQEALKYNLKCYELRKTILGEDHPDTLASLNDLALTYSYLGNYQEALEYNLKCYERSKDILGDEHPNTLASLNNLALTYSYLGKYQEALEYYLKCYELLKEVLGDEHPDTITTLNNLADCYSDLGRYQEALDYNLKCYEFEKAILGEEHPNTITSLNGLAYCYSNLGRYQEALEYNLKCYEHNKTILGEDHPNTLTSLGNLAYCYSNLGRYQKALEYNLKCYEHKKAILGDKHPNTISSLNGLAYCYSNLGRYQEALEYNLKCYELRKEVLGDEHPDTLMSLHNLADCYSNLGRDKEAMECSLKYEELKKAALNEEQLN